MVPAHASCSARAKSSHVSAAGAGLPEQPERALSLTQSTPAPVPEHRPGTAVLYSFCATSERYRASTSGGLSKPGGRVTFGAANCLCGYSLCRGCHEKITVRGVMTTVGAIRGKLLPLPIEPPHCSRSSGSDARLLVVKRDFAGFRSQRKLHDEVHIGLLDHHQRLLKELRCRLVAGV